MRRIKPILHMSLDAWISMIGKWLKPPTHCHPDVVFASDLLDCSNDRYQIITYPSYKDRNTSDPEP